MALVGCPFCQELRPDTEAQSCPVCGVDLIPIERMPPSYESRAERAALAMATPPEHRTLPLSFLGRGRGALILLAILGLAAFFSPWVHVTRPDEFTLSGFELARARAGWFFGGAVGWFVLLPIVVTRRTIAAMRGVRIVAVTFSSLTVAEVVVLLATRPAGSRYVPVELSWEWGLYASAVVSVLGMIVGARFGGRLDEIRLSASTDPLEASLEDTSQGETLH